MGLTLIMDRKFVNRTNKHVDQRGEGHSEPLVAEHYYGPNVRQSAWSLWEIYSAGGSQSHLRHRLIGTIVELEESSLGDFRCCSNDFDITSIVTKYGMKRPTDSFCAQDIVSGIRSHKLVGNRMLSQQLIFGNWTAELILTDNSLVCVGMSTSINIPAVSFRISNGVPEQVSMSWDTATNFVKTALHQDGRKFDDVSSTLNQRKDDRIGIIRRGVMSRTTFQKMEEESAIAYMNLPVSKRTAAVDAVEQNYLFNCRAHGLISGEEFQTRSDAISNGNLYSSPCLRARDSLAKAMYINEDRTHFPDTYFPQWSHLTWAEKLNAVLENEAGIRGRSYLPDVSGKVQSRSMDPELPMDKRYSSLYQALKNGDKGGGFCIERDRLRRRELMLVQKARVGKEIDQIFEECEVCGRPCRIAGSGLCPRCKEIEEEKAMLEIQVDTLKPDTYLGDPRALLGHPGFDRYIPVPKACDQLMRLKIGVKISSSSVSERRDLLTELMAQAPEIQDEYSKRRVSTRNGRQQLIAQDSSTDLVISQTHLLTEEDIYAALEKLHPMIKSNRFEDVQTLLQQTAALKEESIRERLVKDIIDKRDKFGNTPLMTAVQQGHRRLCKLLVSLKANVNSQNKEGNTPLHYAAMYGYHGLFSYLSKKGADDTVSNYSGKLCYEMSNMSTKFLDHVVMKYENKRKEASSKFPALLQRMNR